MVLRKNFPLMLACTLLFCWAKITASSTQRGSSTHQHRFQTRQNHHSHDSRQFGQSQHQGGGRRGAFNNQYAERRNGNGGTGAADWEEERQLALALQLKVIRKLSMRQWIKERHQCWPSRPSIERLKVEEHEKGRAAVLRRQGWEPQNLDATFGAAKRTKWVEIAGQLINEEKHKVERDDSESQMEQGDWKAPQRLRGGGASNNIISFLRGLRSSVDDTLGIQWTRKDGQKVNFSISGCALDTFLIAPMLLTTCHILADIIIGVPLIFLYQTLLLPLVLLWIHPSAVTVSANISTCGIRLVTCAIFGGVSGFIFARIAESRLAFQARLLPILYAAFCHLGPFYEYVSSMEEDRGVQAIHIFSCHIPAVLLFAWIALGGADRSTSHPPPPTLAPDPTVVCGKSNQFAPGNVSKQADVSSSGRTPDSASAGKGSKLWSAVGFAKSAEALPWLLERCAGGLRRALTAGIDRARVLRGALASCTVSSFGSDFTDEFHPMLAPAGGAATSVAAGAATAAGMATTVGPAAVTGIAAMPCSGGKHSQLPSSSPQKPQQQQTPPTLQGLPTLRPGWLGAAVPTPSHVCETAAEGSARQSAAASLAPHAACAFPAAAVGEGRSSFRFSPKSKRRQERGQERALRTSPPLPQTQLPAVSNPPRVAHNEVECAVEVARRDMAQGAVEELSDPAPAVPVAQLPALNVSPTGTEADIRSPTPSAKAVAQAVDNAAESSAAAIATVPASIPVAASPSCCSVKAADSTVAAGATSVTTTKSVADDLEESAGQAGVMLLHPWLRLVTTCFGQPLGADHP